MPHRGSESVTWAAVKLSQEDAIFSCAVGVPMTPRTPRHKVPALATSRSPLATPQKPSGNHAPAATPRSTPRSPRLIPHGWSSTALPTPRRTTAAVSELVGRLAKELGGGVEDGTAMGASMLVSLLQGGHGKIVIQMAAAAVCNWALDSPDAQADLIDAGAVKPLVCLLSDRDIKHTALQAILSLTCTVPEARDQVVLYNGVPILLSVLRSAEKQETAASGPSIVDLASGVLAYLSIGSAANAAEVISGNGVEAFVGLLRDGRVVGVAAEVATSALCNLAKACPDAGPRIRGCNGLEVLVRAADGDLGRSAVSSAIQVLLVVSSNDFFSQAEIRRVGGVSVLARLIEKESVANSSSTTPGRPGVSKIVEAVVCCLWNVLSGSFGESLEELRAAGGLIALVGLLQGEEQIAAIAAGILSDLAEASRAARNRIREAGGIESLVLLLRRRPRGQNSEACCGALANLAVSHPANQHLIRQTGGVAVIVAALSYCSEDFDSGTAEEACRALGNLSRNMANRDAIREADGIHWLITVLTKAPSGAGSVKHAIIALGNLADESHKNQLAIADAGGVGVLFGLMKVGDPGNESMEAMEMASCVLACLMTCEEVTKKADEQVIGTITELLSAKLTSNVVKEALLNILASVSTVPGKQDSIRKMGGIETMARILAAPEQHHDDQPWDPDAPLNSHRSPRGSYSLVRPPDEIAEIAAITVGSMAVGSPLNRAAARESGALAALVHLVSASGPSVSPGVDFSKLLMSQVSKVFAAKHCKDKGHLGAQHDELVMGVLVQLMGTGPDNMLSQIASDALHARKQLSATQASESPEKAHHQADTDEVHVVATGEHLRSRQKLSQLNKRLLSSCEMVDADDESNAVAKSVEIDPKKSVQVDALYSKAFASSATPSPACKAAISALAALSSGDEGNQMAIWETGGIRLLEALLSLGAIETQRCSEDAVRVLQSIASAAPNRDGLLKSGGTEQLINLMRLGPSKDLSYIVARVVSLLISDHEPTVRRARELGALEMLVRLLEPSRSLASKGAGKRSTVVSLCHLCTGSKDSQVIFRKAGGIQLLLSYLEEFSNGHNPDGAGWAARLAGIVCADNAANKDSFQAMDGMRPLVQLLYHPKRLPPQVILRVLEAMRQAMAKHKPNQTAFGRARGIEVLARSMEHLIKQEGGAGSTRGSIPILCSLIATLTCSAMDNAENQDRARKLGTISMVVQCLSAGTASEVIAQAAEALKVLARNHVSNKEAILATGGTKALLQLLSLDMVTELEVITSAAWAVNNLVHNSPGNVDQVLSSRGVQLLLRIVRAAEVRSEASTAASRALFILACNRPMVADVLRWNGGLGPCTMLLTAGPGAETTLWACTLLGLLVDGNQDIQNGIAKNGGLELLLGLIKSRAQGKEVAVAAARTFALLVVDNCPNQDQAIASGAIDILLTNLEAAYGAISSRKFLSQSCPSSVLLAGTQPLSPRAGPDSPLNTRLQSWLSKKPEETTVPSQECLDAMSVEMTEMLIIALANLGSGSLANRKAIQQAGGLLLMEDLMQAAESWQGNIAQLSKWAHSVMRNTTGGAVATSVNLNHPLYALMTSRQTQ